MAITLADAKLAAITSSARKGSQLDQAPLSRHGVRPRQSPHRPARDRDHRWELSTW
ncbi:hypothetical protein [Goodfellowiella coeruleoviolacea]|uniref:hypothetical protein n=1 Tax=Goodfellowiella coeruleoviolacea TaxID=334858 RepID=UPI0020A56D2C|nr:hypothetical protein [Goodfellowiella coeruleoviolacea]